MKVRDVRDPLNALDPNVSGLKLRSGLKLLSREEEEAEGVGVETTETEMLMETVEQTTLRRIVRNVEPNILNAQHAMATTSVRPNVTHAMEWGISRTVVH